MMRESIILTIVVSMTTIQSAVRSAIVPAPQKDTFKHNHEINLISQEDEPTTPKVFAKIETPRFAKDMSIRAPYVVEITRNYLKFQTTGFKAHDVQLNKNESEELQKLSLAFVRLLEESQLSGQSDTEVLDWRQLNPVITLTNSGISIRFVEAADSPISEHENNDRSVYWNFVTLFAKNVFEEKLKEMNVTLPDDGQFQLETSPYKDDFHNFLHILWQILKVSVNYAESTFQNWTTTTTANTFRKEVKKSMNES